jgi:hypothetical protein
MISDRDYYIIKVYTGMRRGAGTTSRIAFVLTGENSDTGPRELFDGFRKVCTKEKLKRYNLKSFQIV